MKSPRSRSIQGGAGEGGEFLKRTTTATTSTSQEFEY